MSLNREDYRLIFGRAKEIYRWSRQPNIREHARIIAAMVEGIIGQQCEVPAAFWNDKIKHRNQFKPAKVAP